MQHIGVDIVEVARIDRVVEHWGERFLQRVFTPAELVLFRSKPQSLAARFAAKEAVLKALDACDRGISWQDIEILAEPNGKPVVSLKGRAAQAAEALQVRTVAVSLSHSQNHAVAFAMGVSNAADRSP